ncbi:ribonuclease E [Thioalkalivibrio sp. ALE21]|uniref:Rne/Rng family ribonuclease n=1 Tax=Thioalkalivibrio sp. ALE21 TaxID=1158175 RepID=UPI000D8E5316|nr:Rne/Rng family ribonuclease [Thioalkalivibrio sp. ALE21]PYG04051.1 ribonuclease E [Thioalkalivibrio sp. ALE21]
MKRILINATQPEELRVAMVDGQRLYDLDIELPSRERKKANIYKAKITRVEPSLEAAFVNFGADRHGFLPFKEIAHSAVGAPADSDKPVREFLKEGLEILVQVEKEERGTKGAALTTFISLAGRYLVLMPNNPKAGGVSRRIEGEDRAELREALSGLNIPEEMGLIARTAGVGRSTEELQWDLDYMTALWSAVTEASKKARAPALIHQESNVIIRALRDHMRTDVGEVIIDDDTIYEQADEFVRMVMPNSLRKLKHYTDPVPLFNRYQIESQIESAFDREVQLPSGGALVIDHTEALISIDVNSARSTKGGDIEETAFHTNLEAAEEVARQLRIRDLGGLIVIDFIDMSANKHQREVENRLREALEMDRARVQVGRISRFGLLEMSRQRLRSSLGESSQITCPRCHGHGQIRSVESMALSILRLMEEEGMKDRTGLVLAQVPVDVGTFLLNEKRQAIGEIEERHGVEISIIPNPQFFTPHFTVQRVRGDEREDVVSDRSSHQLVEIVEEDPDPHQERRQKPEKPLVQGVRVSAPPPESPAAPPTGAGPSAPAGPPPEPVAQPGFFGRIWSALFPNSRPPASTAGTPTEADTPAEGEARGRRRGKGGERGPDRNRKSGDRSGDSGGNGSRRSRGGKGDKSRKSDKPDKSGEETRTGKGGGRNGGKPEGDDKPRKEKTGEAGEGKGKSAGGGRSGKAGGADKSRKGEDKSEDKTAPEGANEGPKTAETSADTPVEATTQEAADRAPETSGSGEDSGDDGKGRTRSRRSRRGGRRRGGRARSSDAAADSQEPRDDQDANATDSSGTDSGEPTADSSESESQATTPVRSDAEPAPAAAPDAEAPEASPSQEDSEAASASGGRKPRTRKPAKKKESAASEGDADNQAPAEAQAEQAPEAASDDTGEDAGGSSSRRRRSSGSRGRSRAAQKAEGDTSDEGSAEPVTEPASDAASASAPEAGSSDESPEASTAPSSRRRRTSSTRSRKSAPASEASDASPAADAGDSKPADSAPADTGGETDADGSGSKKD